MALTSQRSRTSRTLRRLSLKLGTLVIAALAVTMALGLAAPAAGQAAVSVQRLGYCGGDALEAAQGPHKQPAYPLVTHYARADTRWSPVRPNKPPDTMQVYTHARTTCT